MFFQRFKIWFLIQLYSHVNYYLWLIRYLSNSDCILSSPCKKYIYINLQPKNHCVKTQYELSKCLILPPAMYSTLYSVTIFSYLRNSTSLIHVKKKKRLYSSLSKHKESMICCVRLKMGKGSWAKKVKPIRLSNKCFCNKEKWSYMGRCCSWARIASFNLMPYLLYNAKTHVTSSTYFFYEHENHMQLCIINL